MNGFIDDRIEKENLEAYEKLLSEKDSLNANDLTKYRYYADLYGDYEYRWYTHKQEDGKFKAEVVKCRIKNGWMNRVVVKTRSFAKKKTAIKWCYKLCLKARKHQQIVLNDRKKRKELAESLKPKLSESEQVVINARRKIEHYENLQKKADKKIKALTTRKKTYQKRIKYYQKKFEHGVIINGN